MIRRWLRRGTAMALMAASATGAGCGGGGAAAHPDRKEVSLPEALTCDGAFPPGEAFTAEPTTEAPRRATQPMSDAGAEGTRLWKAQRWESAIPLLRAAAGGRGGDDRANKDLAQFRLGVALLLTGRDGEAKALLGVIARDPANAARAEMVTWLAESCITHPGLAHYFGAFDDADVASIEGSESVRAKVNYLIGRQRYERRTFADAMFFFAQVKPPSRYVADAKRCVAKIDANTNAARGTQASR